MERSVSWESFLALSIAISRVCGFFASLAMDLAMACRGLAALVSEE
jgi:hypothetical protein